MIDTDILDDILMTAVPFALPLRRPFRGVDSREGMLLRGPLGWAEFAPFDDYDDRGAARWLDAAIEAAYTGWPESVRSRVPVNAIVPACGPDDAALMTREAVVRHGCTTIKVKVGTSHADDEARVAAVRDALDAALGRGEGRIRIDANGAWTVDEARRVLARLTGYGLDYVEQPCATVDELIALRRLTDVAIAADESVRRADDPACTLAAEAADVIILKAAPLGGVRAALDLAEAAAGKGLGVVVSGALDSSVGLSAGLALAGALPSLDLACGLGTGALLAADLVPSAVVPAGGYLEVQRHAPHLDSMVEARERVSDERAAWWRERLVSAWQARTLSERAS